MRPGQISRHALLMRLALTTLLILAVTEASGAPHRLTILMTGCCYAYESPDLQMSPRHIGSVSQHPQTPSLTILSSLPAMLLISGGENYTLQAMGGGSSTSLEDDRGRRLEGGRGGGGGPSTQRISGVDLWLQRPPGSQVCARELSWWGEEDVEYCEMLSYAFFQKNLVICIGPISLHPTGTPGCGYLP